MKKLVPKRVILISIGVLIVFLILLASAFVLGDIQGKHNGSNVSGTSDSQANLSDNPLRVQALEVSDIDIYQLWTDTNDQRINAGLAPLSLNPKLNQSATAKCNDMVAKNYWSHDDPAGNPPWHFITDAGISYIHLAENLGTGFDSASAEINGWMASAEHKANILGVSYTDVGFAVCKSNSFVGHQNLPSLIVVQHFAQF